MSYLVLHVRPWDFATDDGERKRGATVTYLDLQAATEPGEVGHAPLSMSVGEELVPSFGQAPALYDLDFRHRRGKGGKPVLVLAGAKAIRPVNLGQSENQKTV